MFAVFCNIFISSEAKTIELYCGIDVVAGPGYTDYCGLKSKNSPTLQRTDEITFRFDNAQNVSDVEKVLLRSSIFLEAHFIPPQVFKAFPRMKKFAMPNSAFEISKSEFIGGQNLEEIDLDHNDIRTIPAYVFHELINIRRINLNTNTVTTIEDYAFYKLKRLKKLTIRHGRLTRIGRHTFGHLPSLTHLDIAAHNISVIEEGALHLPQLRILDLSYNNFKTLPNTLFAQTPLLTDLNVRDNVIEFINDAIYPLVHLETLRLRTNQLKDFVIKRIVKTLPHLKILTLGETGYNIDNITVSPEEIKATTSKIEQLSLAENGMQNGDIFAKLKLFPNLKIIDLTNNPIRELDLNVLTTDELPNLSALNIQNSIFVSEWLRQKASDPTFKFNYEFCVHDRIRLTAKGQVQHYEYEYNSACTSHYFNFEN